MSILENKYIVFIYRENFAGSLGSALGVYHFQHGNLNNVFSPGSIFTANELRNKIADPKTGKKVGVNDLVIQKLQEMGVKEVVSISRKRNFFSIPHGIQNLSTAENSCSCLWDTICVDDPEYRLLTINGIKVRFYDYDKDIFID